MWKKMRQYIFAVLAIVCSSANAGGHSERGFLFTVPRVFTRNAVNDLYLDLFDVDAPGEVTVSLLKTNSNSSAVTIMTSHVERGKTRVNIPFEVPDVEDYEARIKIDGSFGSDDYYKFSGEERVTFRKGINKIIFIQTDKPIYKIGQEVKFRILPVDTRLKPLAKNTVGDVWVEDPTGLRMAQWKKVELGKGIKQLQFSLSNEPNLGSWKISVSIGETTQSTSFEVKEYVLPKFEVVIKPPSYVLADAEIIPIEVCGKYTYGQLVQGELKLNITLETYYYWRNSEKVPFLEVDQALDGCYTYDLNVSRIDIDYKNTYRQIKVFAQIKESGTDIIRNETKFISRTQTPLNLRFETRSREYFKSGLPYKGSVKVTYPDDTPAAKQPIEICTTVTRQRNICGWSSSKKVVRCRNLTSNAHGIVTFTVPPQTEDSISMNIQAKSLKYLGEPSTSNKPKLYRPESSLYLRPWYSPSGSQLQIQGIGQALSCGKSKNLKVLFTAEDEGDYRFYYEVIVRDKVVKRSFKDVSFQEEDSLVYHSEDMINNKKVKPPKKKKQGKQTKEESLWDEIEEEMVDETMCSTCVQDTDYVPFIGVMDIEVDISAFYSPSFRLLVYYVRDDSETVADSQMFTVKKCFQNQVTFKFGDTVKQPGRKTSLTVSASPNSLCGVKVVDKSISLLDSSDQLTKERIFQEIENLNHGNYYPRNLCNKRQYPGLLSKSAGNYVYRPIIPDNPYSSSPYEDSVTAFELAGFYVISDLRLLTRPCKTESYDGPVFAYADSAPRRIGMSAGADMELSAAPGGGANTKSAVDVRTFFPETWLFDVVEVGKDGVFLQKPTLPHTITEWVGSAVCINREDGLGLSNTTSIKGFQEFFASFTLPYSVIRGEKVPVVITVFNYIDKCLPIVLELEESPGFILLSDSPKTELCVCGGKSVTYNFSIRPTIIGSLNLTVQAQSDYSSDICGDEVVSKAVARDAVRNPLLVEAEGFPVTEVSNYLFCPKDSQNGVFKQDFHYTPANDIVEDSARGYLGLTGDIMGPSIQNIDRLVQMPTGCGEQNIVLFAPNVYVLDYLQATNQLTDQIKNKALRNLREGYQRELAYKHSDGSFSAFGSRDGSSGSMFLTAFVVRSFAQSAKYIDIDAKSMNESAQWMISKQSEGCFPEVGVTYHSAMKGGIKNTNSSGSLTAYVLISLLTYELKNEQVIDDALHCFNKENIISSYQAALFAYASALAGDTQKANSYMEDLLSLSNTTAGVTYFPSRDGHPEVEVETAAYAILALLQLGQPTSEILPIIRYITTMRNSNGGFVGTQDTVVALEALSKFAKLLGDDPVDLQIECSGSLTKEVSISEDDKILVKKYPVDKVPGHVSVAATGTGCGLVQSVLLYNTPHPLKLNYFSLQVEAKRKSVGQCKYVDLQVCSRYLPEGKKSNMALIQIKMVSGMVVSDLDTLRKNPAQVGAKRVEFENNELILYFDEITNERKCFNVTVEEIVQIEDRKPGVAKVYDYYAKNNEEQTTYTIEKCP